MNVKKIRPECMDYLNTPDGEYILLHWPNNSVWIIPLSAIKVGNSKEIEETLDQLAIRLENTDGSNHSDITN